jgi:DhnA family fructose-bisphosphate aldolase class Ia
MSGMVGKKRKMARLLHSSVRPILCLAYDHGMQLGPIDGVKNPGEMISKAVETEVSAIIMTPGVYVEYADLLSTPHAPAVILRLDQTSMWRIGEDLGYEEGHTRQIATVEEAVRLGAEAVISFMFFGHDTPALETNSMEIAARIAEQARKWGVVHICEPMAARQGIATDVYDPDVIAFGARIASEIGADIVKTDYTGDPGSFQEVTKEVEAPVLAAGGSRLDTDQEVLNVVADIRDSGAAGILFGRNIFQSPKPARLMKSMHSLLNEGAEEGAALRMTDG